MKQEYASLNPTPHNLSPIETSCAHYLAGQAVAICLGNRQKHLPDVFFHVLINQPEQYIPHVGRLFEVRYRRVAKIVGGRLIQDLPLAFAESPHFFTEIQQEQYQCAFEADIVNVLSGPLAEAKYIAERDDEPFSANLITPESLRFYGASQDMATVAESLTCYIPEASARESKLKDLLLAAFEFVNQPSHWQAIKQVAEFLQNVNKSTVTCEEIASSIGEQPHRPSPEMREDFFNNSALTIDHSRTISPSIR